MFLRAHESRSVRACAVFSSQGSKGKQCVLRIKRGVVEKLIGSAGKFEGREKTEARRYILCSALCMRSRIYCLTLVPVPSLEPLLPETGAASPFLVVFLCVCCLRLKSVSILQMPKIDISHCRVRSFLTAPCGRTAVCRLESRSRQGTTKYLPYKYSKVPLHSNLYDVTVYE